MSLPAAINTLAFHSGLIKHQLKYLLNNLLIDITTMLHEKNCLEMWNCILDLCNYSWWNCNFICYIENKHLYMFWTLCFLSPPTSWKLICLDNILKYRWQIKMLHNGFPGKLWKQQRWSRRCCISISAESKRFIRFCRGSVWYAQRTKEKITRRNL